MVGQRARVCARCGDELTRDGTHSECKTCHLWRERIRAFDNPERVADSRFRSRLKKYGLSEQQFRRLLYFQNGMCAICGELLLDELNIDHDKETGKVRGLLCSPCNTAIGLLKHDRASCLSAAHYLKRGGVF